MLESSGHRIVTMTVQADQDDGPQSTETCSEWAAWRLHRRRIYLLVALSALAMLASVAVFVLGPLQGEMDSAMRSSALQFLDSSARLFDARSRRLLQRAELIAADARLTAPLSSSAGDLDAIALGLQGLRKQYRELSGLAVLTPNGGRLVRVGQVPALSEKVPLERGVRPVRLTMDDAGLLFNVPVQSAAGGGQYWLQLVFEGAAFHELMAPRSGDDFAPFIRYNGQAFFTDVLTRMRLGECGGLSGVLVNGCDRRFQLLERPLAGADWSLVFLLDGGGWKTYLAVILDHLPMAILAAGIVLVLMTTMVVRPMNHLFSRTGRLLEMSARDELTGLNNRRHLMQSIDAELARAVRHGLALNLMLLDIDHFKTINDTHGHAVGDVAIKEVAQALSRLSRSEDVTARLGGDEFVVLQTDVSLEGAVRFAERLRRTIRDVPVIAVGERVRLSVSVGVAHIPAGQANRVTRERLLNIADKALYKAKAGGRNQVAARGLREPSQASAKSS